MRSDEETGQTILSGMGELHLEILVDRLFREFSLEAGVGKPQVAYRETIRAEAAARGRFVRQSGGRGQFGDVEIAIKPLVPGGGFQFVDKIVGGVIPREYIPAVENGVREAMENGVWPAIRCSTSRSTLFDGSFHAVDSSEIAFKIAGSMAFREAAKKAKPVLLEPIMDMEVVCPADFLGDVMGDLTSRRGRDSRDGGQGGRQGGERLRTAFGDVRLRDRRTVDDPGPGDLYDAVRPLRRNAASACRGIDGEKHRARRSKRYRRVFRERGALRPPSSVFHQKENSRHGEGEV